MLKVAISGAGYAAHYFVKSLTELGCPVAGITNRTKDHGVELAKEAGTRFYDTLDDLLANSDAEALLVTTATTRHIQDIRCAAENGIRWIFCEKPAGVDLGEIRQIKTICDEYQIKLGIGYKMRYESVFSQAKKLIDEGRIGKLVSITLNFYQPVPHSSWYLDNGFIRETMAHPIDLTNWLASSQPQVVVCQTQNCLGGLKEDRASLFVKFESGLTSCINGGWISQYPYIAGRKNICFEIVGTGGYICGIRPDILILCDENGQDKITFGLADPIKEEFLDFSCRVTQGNAPSIGIDAAIQAHEVIDAAVRSAASGNAVRIDHQ